MGAGREGRQSLQELQRQADANGHAQGADLRGRAPSDLGVERFAALMGVSTQALPESCREIIRAADFRHEVFRDGAREAVLLDVLRTLDGELSAAGPARVEATSSLDGTNSTLRRSR